MANLKSKNGAEKEMSATRPPVVVVLGHVDHGKSSLLEAIREDFRITAKESGGITQHIGAYVVEHPSTGSGQVSKSITFLDTPGHELFSAMRSRGAKVADIAILVVAADESIKPQTVEAIGQVKKAGIPMVVAINKIDKPDANAERVKQELAQHDVMVESYGGDVPSVETSATAKRGIKELLEMILLVAELENLQADENKPGQGMVLEARLDPKRGPTTTILVGDGVVTVGDFIATNSAYGKVRLLEDFQKKGIQRVLPSMPAVVLGFLKAPAIGEEFRVFENEVLAQEFATQKEEKREEAPRASASSGQKNINIVLKADVAGSLGALKEALVAIPSRSSEGGQEDVGVCVVEAGVGEVGENDVKLAHSTEASILNFRSKVSVAGRDLAEKEKVSIESFEVIYEVIEAVRNMLEKSIEDEGGREEIGTLHVLAIFLVDKKRQVIGGKVVEGEIRNGLRAEILRGGEVIGQGRVTNLQHDKKDVPLVKKGKECGLSFEAPEGIQEGDTLQFFVEKAPKK